MAEEKEKKHYIFIVGSPEKIGDMVSLMMDNGYVVFQGPILVEAGALPKVGQAMIRNFWDYYK